MANAIMTVLVVVILAAIFVRWLRERHRYGNGSDGVELLDGISDGNAEIFLHEGRTYTMKRSARFKILALASDCVLITNHHRIYTKTMCIIYGKIRSCP